MDDSFDTDISSLSQDSFLSCPEYQDQQPLSLSPVPFSDPDKNQVDVGFDGVQDQQSSSLSSLPFSDPDDNQVDVNLDKTHNLQSSSLPLSPSCDPNNYQLDVNVDGFQDQQQSSLYPSPFCDPDSNQVDVNFDKGHDLQFPLVSPSPSSGLTTDQVDVKFDGVQDQEPSSPSPLPLFDDASHQVDVDLDLTDGSQNKADDPDNNLVDVKLDQIDEAQNRLDFHVDVTGGNIQCGHSYATPVPPIQDNNIQRLSDTNQDQIPSAPIDRGMGDVKRNPFYAEGYLEQINLYHTTLGQRSPRGNAKETEKSDNQADSTLLVESEMADMNYQTPFDIANDSLSVTDTCICEALAQVLHDGCLAQFEKMSGKDPVESTLESTLQQQYHMPNPYQCPQHGLLPDAVSLSKCQYCTDNETEAGLDLRAEDEDGKSDSANLHYNTVEVSSYSSESTSFHIKKANRNIRLNGDGDIAMSNATNDPDVEIDYTTSSSTKSSSIKTTYRSATKCEDVSTERFNSNLQHALEDYANQISSNIIKTATGVTNTISLDDFDDIDDVTCTLSDTDNKQNNTDVYADLTQDVETTPNDVDSTQDVETTPNDVDSTQDVETTPNDVDSTQDVETAPSNGMGVTGGLSPEEKEKRKVLNKASKKLLKANKQMEASLQDVHGGQSDVQQQLEAVDSNRVEVEKALCDHVTYLHSLLDHYHSQQKDVLRQHHKQFLQQHMVNRTEILNFEAKLTNVKRCMDETLHRVIKDRDVTAAKPTDVSTLCDDVHKCISSKPPKQTMAVTYLVEIPRVRVQEVEALVGRIIITNDNQQAPNIPQSCTVNATGSSSTSSQHPVPGLKTEDPTFKKSSAGQTGSGKNKTHKTAYGGEAMPKPKQPTQKPGSHKQEMASDKQPAQKPGSKRQAESTKQPTQKPSSVMQAEAGPKTENGGQKWSVSKHAAPNSGNKKQAESSKQPAPKSGTKEPGLASKQPNPKSENGGQVKANTKHPAQNAASAGQGKSVGATNKAAASPQGKKTKEASKTPTQTQAAASGASVNPPKPSHPPAVHPKEKDGTKVPPTKTPSSKKTTEMTCSQSSRSTVQDMFASMQAEEMLASASLSPIHTRSMSAKEYARDVLQQVQEQEISASLASKNKLSETMASCSSMASAGSTSSSQARKRARRRRKRQKKAAAAALSKPAMIILHAERPRPLVIKGRKTEARGFAARPNGEMWVVYGDRNPHLDRVNERGDLVESFRVGGNAASAASFSEEHVLLAVHLPCCQLRLLDGSKETRETIKLPLIPLGLGVGSTGIAVCGHASLYWIPLDGGKNQWIVKEDGSTLKNACSCDINIIEGREIVCVADSEGHKVWFYEKLDNDEFAPLPLFTYASQDKTGKSIPFSPVCVTVLTGSSFLAVLDGESRSVIIVDMEKNEAVSVITQQQLCTGVPSIISFALTEPGHDPKLWVTSNTGYLYVLSLAFLY